MAKLRIKKGDRVVVIAGRDRGRRGEVLQVLPKENRVVVQGVNLVKKHQRQSQRQEGGIIQKEAPINVSNVAHIDPKTHQPTRVRFEVLEDGNKVRIASRSGERIDR
ncbi:LSU ribosomal protein L24p (L26e) [invertebrate metagenome]|uniref:LSU ribosomal protein L24p (L26e) n=1 Tax=invertebrate metagenome TaxID=1711999 RepID=A0A484H9T7_9ZZZZ